MASPIVTQSAIKGDVPGYLAKPIGHIIVKWAFLEYCLSRLIWELVGVEPQVGRVAISSPRAHEKLDNIRELLFLKRKVMMDDRIFNALRSRIIEANGLRDNLCHGQWANDDRGWAIISTRGFVTDQTIERIERSRKFRPERMSVTVASLTPIFARINELVSAVESIEKQQHLPKNFGNNLFEGSFAGQAIRVQNPNPRLNHLRGNLNSVGLSGTKFVRFHHFCYIYNCELNP